MATKKPKNGKPLEIIVGIQHDGAAYQLDPLSEDRLQLAHPESRLLRSVFLGHWRETDFEALQSPHWKQMALLLTGLTEEQLAEMGGVVVLAPQDEGDRVVWEWKPAVKAPPRAATRTSRRASGPSPGRNK